MRISKLPALAAVVALAVLALLPACSVSVKDKEDGDTNKVDISTPIGGIHVNEDADVRDTGLTVYPGARQKPKTKDGDEKSANVNISGFGFGLKVVALEYESDDPPGKIIDFYQGQLKQFGHVLQCHTSHRENYNVNFGDHDSRDSHELKCEAEDGGSTVELKAGTKENQHVVAVESEGKGTGFSLVYIRAHGKDTI
jgi:hypothetical protein